MYGLIYRFGRFDGFIYGFLAVASLCASVASDGDSDVQIYGFIYRFNLFYIYWILVRMLVTDFSSPTTFIIKEQIISIAKGIRLEEP